MAYASYSRIYLPRAGRLSKLRPRKSIISASYTEPNRPYLFLAKDPLYGPILLRPQRFHWVDQRGAIGRKQASSQRRYSQAGQSGAQQERAVGRRLIQLRA